MTAKLEKPIKREIAIAGEPFVLTLAPDGVTIVPKGKRKGRHFTWRELWSGEAELAADLRASLDALRR